MGEESQRPIHPPMQRALAETVKKLAAAGHCIVELKDEKPFVAEACAVSWEYCSLDADRTSLGHIARSGEPPIPSLRFTYDLDRNGPVPDLRKLFGLNISHNEITANMRRIFVENKLNLIIGPGSQSCAVPHDTYGLPMYTVLENLVDYPACVMPSGKANEIADSSYLRYVAYEPPYRPKDVERAPCHIQLVGRRLRDEEPLRNLAIVETVLRS